MREAATRGFWITTYAPYGYKRVYVQDGIKKRPKLELNPPADAVVRRIFDMATGQEHPGHHQDPQRRGHPHHQRASTGSRPLSTACSTTKRTQAPWFGVSNCD